MPPQTFLGGVLIIASIGLIVFRRRNDRRATVTQS
jgi:LPXTG-motif cell wall-anchored protein